MECGQGSSITDDARAMRRNPQQETMDVTLQLHPYNTQQQCVSLCQELSAQIGAEIVRVDPSDSGITIRAAVPSNVDTLQWLNRLPMVAEAWEGSSDLPAFGPKVDQDAFPWWNEPSPDEHHFFYVSLSPFK